MEENDNRVSRQIREQFRGFEPEPPADSWEAIRRRLDGKRARAEVPRESWSLANWWQPRRLYPALAVVGLFLITLFIWLAVNPSHQIKGQAFIDQAELTKGTAYLFRVRDQQAPYDSVGFLRKTELDSSGHFIFDDIPSGSYLLRIHAGHDELNAQHDLHGYYGDQLHWDSARLLSTDHPQDTYVIRIPKKR